MFDEPYVTRGGSDPPVVILIRNETTVPSMGYAPQFFRIDRCQQHRHTTFNKVRNELPIAQADALSQAPFVLSNLGSTFRRGRAWAPACARTKSHDATFLITFVRRTP